MAVAAFAVPVASLRSVLPLGYVAVLQIASTESVVMTVAAAVVARAV
jgi:hypothetical protein